MGLAGYHHRLYENRLPSSLCEHLSCRAKKYVNVFCCCCFIKPRTSTTTKAHKQPLRNIAFKFLAWHGNFFRNNHALSITTRVETDLISSLLTIRHVFMHLQLVKIFLTFTDSSCGRTAGFLWTCSGLIRTHYMLDALALPSCRLAGRRGRKNTSSLIFNCA